MQVHQAYRYELAPNNRQRTQLAQHAGTARFAYNWGIARRIEAYKQTGKSLSAIDLHRELNALKKTDFPWLYEVSKWAPQEALRDLDKAFARFFKGLKGEGPKAGYPRFKSKGKCRDSFRLGSPLKAEGQRVRLPRLGWISTKEPTDKLQGRILSTTVSREADRWFVSFAVERERPNPSLVAGDVIGVDLGIKSFATLSDGTHVEGPNVLRKSQKRLRRLERAKARKEKGSANRRKAVLQVARQHRRVANQRKDFLHKLSSELAKTKSVIVLEDLNISGLVKNHHIAMSVCDQGWGEFRRQLQYKTKWYGSRLIICDRFFPSTKLCSGCGCIKETVSLSERTYRCDCGLILDRDENAARNLRQFGLRVIADELTTTASLAGSNACGEEGAGSQLQLRVKPTSKKQEENSSQDLLALVV